MKEVSFSKRSLDSYLLKMGIVVSYLRGKEETPDFEPFTSEDVANIKRKWVIPRDRPMDVGEKILYRYFEHCPEYQNYFEHFKNSPLLTLKGAPGFRTHAGRMIRIFDENVEVLGRDDYEFEMEKIWLRIARSHYQRHIPQKAFRDFKYVAIELLQEECDLTNEEIKSFDKFFTNIQHIVFVALENMHKAEKRRS